MNQLFKKIRNNLIFTASLFWLSYLLSHHFLIGKFWFWNLTSVIPPMTYVLISLSFTFLFLAYKALANKDSKVKDFKNVNRKTFVIIVLLLISVFLSLPISDINLNYIENKLAKYDDFSRDEVLVLFNWNTLYWEPDNNIDHFISHIKSQEADIYTLQEFGVLSPSETFDYFYYNNEKNRVGNEFQDYYVDAYEDMLTISKYPFVDENTVRKKYWTRLDVDLGNNEILTVYNVHMPVQFYGQGTVIENIKSKFEIRKYYFDTLLDDVKDNNNQYIIAGDFNSTKAMGSMNNLLKLTKDSYTKSRVLFPATWEDNGLKLWRIDYSLISSGLDFIRHDDVDPIYFSDHWGQRSIIKGLKLPKNDS
ncbi:MAG: endonuclease/exonuclease/phosphatase family protein [Candidatus Dojkabacteria bacterium]|nr:endonuclease/exonuclease/phosphatase family protein [Candidatus Dojkabacteria bacterium]MDQ7021493.1 endonuclease/exonuclease/phosphatase family protein [Candidatus Dojkabacteria bacterium]